MRKLEIVQIYVHCSGYSCSRVDSEYIHIPPINKSFYNEETAALHRIETAGGFFWSCHLSDFALRCHLSWSNVAICDKSRNDPWQSWNPIFLFSLVESSRTVITDY